MSLEIDNLWVVQIGGVDIWITRTLFNTWILMLVLIVFAIFTRCMLRRFREVPLGFQNAVEAVVEVFDHFMLNSAGERLMFLGNWFFTVFAFLLTANLSGLVGLRPPTADWATASALALATFLLVQVMGIRYRGKSYLKTFFRPHPVFFPLNLIGELARPISLSFRLYGNVLAGVILTTLVYSIAPIYVRLGLPVALHAYFDLIIGSLQAYIFCILSLMFIRGATE